MQRLIRGFLLMFLTLALQQTASAQVMAAKVTAEEQFHDLFLTAGYSTAFGAALGAAVLGLQTRPGENLRFIAMGASLGFITGSLLGGYMLISPVFSPDNEGSTASQQAPNSNSFSGVSGVSALVTLARF